MGNLIRHITFRVNTFLMNIFKSRKAVTVLGNESEWVLVRLCVYSRMCGEASSYFYGQTVRRQVERGGEEIPHGGLSRHKVNYCSFSLLKPVCMCTCECAYMSTDAERGHCEIYWDSTWRKRGEEAWDISSGTWLFTEARLRRLGWGRTSGQQTGTTMTLSLSLWLGAFTQPPCPLHPVTEGSPA